MLAVKDVTGMNQAVKTRTGRQEYPSCSQNSQLSGTGLMAEGCGVLESLEPQLELKVLL